MSACRFCHSSERDQHGLDVSIKYGVRHYAHPDCYLAAKGGQGLLELHDWQLRNFPYFAAKRAGVDYLLADLVNNARELAS